MYQDKCLPLELLQVMYKFNSLS